MIRGWRTAHWFRRGQIKATLRTLYHAQRGYCAYCKRKTVLPPRTEERVPAVLYASRDHRLPVSRGGADDRGNLAMACEACNNLKGSLLPEEWAAFMLANPAWWDHVEAADLKPRGPTVKTPGFGSGNAGSSPAAAAT